MMANSSYHHVAAVVKITSSKWALPVLHTLADGTKRYHEIGNDLPDITQKMLTDRLHRLENLGFIDRVAYPTVPPRVEYSLTTLGESFMMAYLPIIDWAKANIEKVNL